MVAFIKSYFSWKGFQFKRYLIVEEILNEWNNDDNYYSDELEDQSSEEHKDVQVPAPATIPHLPPVFIQHVRMTPTSTTKKPIYIPHTDIDLGTLSEQVHKARRNELEEPVDLPIPYIVWARDPSGRDDQMNYWKKFYNTVYKVD